MVKPDSLFIFLCEKHLTGDVQDGRGGFQRWTLQIFWTMPNFSVSSSIPLCGGKPSLYVSERSVFVCEYVWGWQCILFKSKI